MSNGNRNTDVKSENTVLGSNNTQNVNPASQVSQPVRASGASSQVGAGDHTFSYYIKMARTVATTDQVKLLDTYFHFIYHDTTEI
jgi:hypothetical protein